jgi:hypothetical protein
MSIKWPIPNEIGETFIYNNDQQTYIWKWNGKGWVTSNIENINEVGLQISVNEVIFSKIIISGKEMIFLNGLLQQEGEDKDYILNENKVLFNFSLSINDVIIGNYFF